MTLATLIAYAAALFVAAATPGPAMFCVISTGLARGAGPAAGVGLGVAIGDSLLVSVALLGLGAVAAAFGWVFAVVKYGGAAYLIWLGIRMWQSAPVLAEARPTAAGRPLRAFGMGAAVALGNPKAILFHLSLMPLLLDIDALTPTGSLAVVGIVFAVNTLTMGAYASLSGVAARWFRSGRQARWMNRLAGSVMVGTGMAIASR